MASSSLRFLLDENVPAALFRFLKENGHDVIKAVPTTSDVDIANQAKRESRILVTLDNDFSNWLRFPPKEFTIILIRLHPPNKEELIEIVKKYLSIKPSPSGFALLERTGPTEILE